MLNKIRRVKIYVLVCLVDDVLVDPIWTIHHKTIPCNSKYKCTEHINVPTVHLCHKYTFKSSNMLDTILRSMHTGTILWFYIRCIESFEPFTALEWRRRIRRIAHITIYCWCYINISFWIFGLKLKKKFFWSKETIELSRCIGYA